MFGSARDLASPAAPLAPVGVRDRLGAVATAFLAYVVFVILFGAVVRITGSGAGCGQNWPTCHGEIAHIPQSIETLIELTHRVTSGLSVLFSIGFLVLVRRAFERGHPARLGAWLSLAFLLSESLVGAALVLLALVGDNSSASRAVVMAFHLLNTSLLTGAIVYARAAILDGEPRAFSALIRTSLRRENSFIVLGGLLLLLVSAFGAVTALGDTLYPVQEGQGSAGVVSSVFTPGEHFLDRLRGIHPLTALAAALFIFWTLGAREGRERPRRHVLLWLTLQIALGVLNVYLRAPAFMQVMHLAVATFLWIAWCWFGYVELTAALDSDATRGKATPP